MSRTSSPVIVITGAGKGIGRAVAEEFSARVSKAFKPRLVLISRTESELKAMAELCAARGVESHVIIADIASAADVDRIVSESFKAFGGIDCLVNNAGVGRFGDFLELTEDDLDYVLSVNLKGTFLLTQKVFRAMKASGSGHIFFVTSTAAEKAFEQSAIYCMSKFGQKGLLEVLRLYGYKHGIRVTNVMPGPVHTPMWGSLDQATVDRMMKPEDVAMMIVDAFLLPQRTSVEEIVIRPVAGDI